MQRQGMSSSTRRYERQVAPACSGEVPTGILAMGGFIDAMANGEGCGAAVQACGDAQGVEDLWIMTQESILKSMSWDDETIDTLETNSLEPASGGGEKSRDLIDVNLGQPAQLASQVCIDESIQDIDTINKKKKQKKNNVGGVLRLFAWKRKTDNDRKRSSILKRMPIITNDTVQKLSDSSGSTIDAKPRGLSGDEYGEEALRVPPVFSTDQNSAVSSRGLRKVLKITESWDKEEGSIHQTVISAVSITQSAGKSISWSINLLSDINLEDTSDELECDDAMMGTESIMQDLEGLSKQRSSKEAASCTSGHADIIIVTPTPSIDRIESNQTTRDAPEQPISMPLGLQPQASQITARSEQNNLPRPFAQSRRSMSRLSNGTRGDREPEIILKNNSTVWKMVDFPCVGDVSTSEPVTKEETQSNLNFPDPDSKELPEADAPTEAPSVSSVTYNGDFEEFEVNFDGLILAEN